MKIKAFLAALPVAMAFAAAGYAGEKEEKIPWTDVPAAVQKTITENAGDGKVGKIEKETKDGQTVYEAKVKKSDGTEIEVKVGQDGELIEVERDAD